MQRLTKCLKNVFQFIVLYNIYFRLKSLNSCRIRLFHGFGFGPDTINRLESDFADGIITEVTVDALLDLIDLESELHRQPFWQTHRQSTVAPPGFVGLVRKSDFTG